MSFQSKSKAIVDRLDGIIMYQNWRGRDWQGKKCNVTYSIKDQLCFF